MASNKIKKSLAKRLAPIILKVNKFLENNTTIINYLIEKDIKQMIVIILKVN